ncbi:MAG TPA: PD-(D/E)XK nuclease family protein [Actinomycetota bacterium]|nr:PD-(D/E)XK nuclease family protein [Actinomycetota bacterium]
MTTERTPAQQRIFDELFGREERPVWDGDIRTRIRSELEDSIRAAVDAMGAAIFVGKYDLDLIHRCEGRWAAKNAKEFAWTIQMIRGRVAHTAIEIAMMDPDAGAPLDLIDRAVAALSDGSEQESVATFLKGLDPIDMARLKGEANNAVVGFMSDWPKVDRRWYPRTEASVRVQLFRGRVKLGAKYDMAFGPPDGMRARVVIVDFKTGKRHSSHVDDLRYYALIETLKTGVPPYRVASYYLHEADFHVETVTEELLQTAIRRTADGIRRIAALQSRQPVMNPGPHCLFCPARETCEPGMHWIAAERPSAAPEYEDEDPI